MIDSLKNQPYSNTHSSKWLLTPLIFFVGCAWILPEFGLEASSSCFFLALFHDSKIPVAVAQLEEQEDLKGILISKILTPLKTNMSPKKGLF